MAKVEVISGEIGRVHELPQGTTRVGRGYRNDILIDDTTLSQRHLTIHCEGGVFVEDTGSKNGSRLDGAEMKPHVRYPVREGSVVKVGAATQLRFRSVDESGPPPAIPHMPTTQFSDPGVAGRLATLERLDPGLAHWVRFELLPARAERRAMGRVLSSLETLGRLVNRHQRIRWLVDAIREETKAPVVWAVAWSGAPSDPIQFDDVVVGAGDAQPPPPRILRGSLIAAHVQHGQAQWFSEPDLDTTVTEHGAPASRDEDPRMPTVWGRVPLGHRGLLFLEEPGRESLWSPTTRAWVEVTCRLVGALPASEGPCHVQAPEGRDPLPPVPGRGNALQEVAERAQAMVPLSAHLLLEGETRFARFQMAQAVHRLMPAMRFISVDSGDPNWEEQVFGSEGALRHGGASTLFVDGRSASAHHLARLSDWTWTHRQGFAGRVMIGVKSRHEVPSAELVLRLPRLAERREDVEAVVEAMVREAPQRVAIGPSGHDALRLAAMSWPLEAVEDLVRRVCKVAASGPEPVVDGQMVLSVMGDLLRG